jgi:hypothetical protein
LTSTDRPTWAPSAGEVIVTVVPPLAPALELPSLHAAASRERQRADAADEHRTQAAPPAGGGAGDGGVLGVHACLTTGGRLADLPEEIPRNRDLIGVLRR